MADAERYWGRIREDFLTHPRTEWFSAIEQSLILQCRCANPLGVLQRSTAHMARVASGDRGLITVTCEMIERSIARLVSSEHCVWYREIETLWWVNMADEQQPNRGNPTSEYWNQLRAQLVPKLDNQVREGLFRRYPRLDPKKSGNHEDVEPATFAEVAQVGLFLPDTDTEPDTEPEGERANKLAPNSPRRGSGSHRIHGAFIDAVIDCLNEHRARVVPNARGFRRTSKSQREFVRRVTRRESATLEDWRVRISNLTEAARRDRFWVAHLTLQYLSRAGSWDKWEHESSIPEGRQSRHAPSDFDRPDRSFGGGLR